MRLIDADALKALPFHRLTHTDFGETCVSFEEIDNAPTVELTFGVFREMLCSECEKNCTECKEKRPQGGWIKIFENPFTNGYVCPFCGHKIQVTEQFLPKVTECEACGADMRRGGVENDL